MTATASATATKAQPVPLVAPEDAHTWRQACNTRAATIMTEMFPSPFHATNEWVCFGKRGEWQTCISPAFAAGSWRNPLAGTEGKHFTEMIAAILNETEARSLQRLAGWDKGNGKQSDKARLGNILKHESEPEEWLDRWAKGHPLTGSRMAKRIRSTWNAEVAFAGDLSHALRSYDSDEKMIALHTDALTDVPVGLSVLGLSLSAEISFGNRSAPIKLHDRVDNRLNLARDLRTGLVMVQAYGPLWVVQSYENLELPKGVTTVGLAINSEPGDRELMKKLKPLYASRGVTVIGLEPENSARWYP